MGISLYCIQGAPLFLPPQKKKKRIDLTLVRLGSLPRPRWPVHHRKRPWVSVYSHSGHLQQEIQSKLGQPINNHCLKKNPKSPISQLYDVIITMNKIDENKLARICLIQQSPHFNITHTYLSLSLTFSVSDSRLKWSSTFFPDVLG